MVRIPPRQPETNLPVSSNSATAMSPGNPSCGIPFIPDNLFIHSIPAFPSTNRTFPRHSSLFSYSAAEPPNLRIPTSKPSPPSSPPDLQLSTPSLNRYGHFLKIQKGAISPVKVSILVDNLASMPSILISSAILTLAAQDLYGDACKYLHSFPTIYWSKIPQY